MSVSESSQLSNDDADITWNGMTIGRTNSKNNEHKICRYNSKCSNTKCQYIHLSFGEVGDLKDFISNSSEINPNVYIPPQVFSDLKKSKEKNGKLNISKSTRSNSCSVPDHPTSSVSGIFTKRCIDSSSDKGRESEEFIEILNIMMRMKNDHRGWASLKEWLSNYIQEEYSPESNMMENLRKLLKISQI
jgi:hypothetical protein